MTEPPSDAPLVLHATTVAVDGRAVVIRGAAGRGKSALALQLIALGAQLVADDGTVLKRRDNGLWASAPAAIRGWIEARGSGLLKLPSAGQARVALVVDLDRVSEERLPQPRTCDLLGVRLPLLHRVDHPHFASTVLLMLRHGRPSCRQVPCPNVPQISYRIALPASALSW